MVLVGKEKKAELGAICNYTLQLASRQGCVSAYFCWLISSKQAQVCFKHRMMVLTSLTTVLLASLVVIALTQLKNCKWSGIQCSVGRRCSFPTKRIQKFIFQPDFWTLLQLIEKVVPNIIIKSATYTTLFSISQYSFQYDCLPESLHPVVRTFQFWTVAPWPIPQLKTYYWAVGSCIAKWWISKCCNS